MDILITNDDGIASPLLHLLVKLSKPLGNVLVVAPHTQCSAMSHRITVRGELTVAPVKDFPVAGVRAYSVTGTPADCVKVACAHLTDRTPDIVFSGINDGINSGYDISYSGTIGAAIEAVMEGIPAIAWSLEEGGGEDVVEAYFDGIVTDLMQKKLPRGQIWNVNFPSCAAADCKGILTGRIPAQHKYYHDSYVRRELSDGAFLLDCTSVRDAVTQEGSDTKAVLDSYISIGIHYSSVMYGKQYQSEDRDNESI